MFANNILQTLLPGAALDWRLAQEFSVKSQHQGGLGGMLGVL